MNKLLIQIVDKNNKLIGAANIEDAHENGLIHRIVRILVENPKTGKLLFQKRSAKMHRWPGCWDQAAGGHVDEGEDYKTAAKRELFEEVGIRASDIEELDAYYSEDVTPDGLVLKRFNKIYKVLYEGEDFNIDKDEVDEVRWMNLDEIRQIFKEDPKQLTAGLIDIIDKYYP